MPALDGLAEVRLGELTLIPCRAAMHGGFMPPRRANMLISDPSVVDRMSIPSRAAIYYPSLHIVQTVAGIELPIDLSANAVQVRRSRSEVDRPPSKG
jgi:hypothetical protein